MHIVYTQGGLPYPGDNGVSMMGWSLIKHCLRQGHKVTVIGMTAPGDHLGSTESQDLVRSLGAELVVLSYERPSLPVRDPLLKRIGRIFSKLDFETVYPWARLQPQMKATLEKLSPDAVIAIHHEPLAALMGIQKFPVLGIMGDPTHLPAYSRWRYIQIQMPIDFLKSAPSMIRWLRDVPGYDVEILQNATRHGALAAHYAEWFGNKGVSDCHYYRVPVADDIGSAWTEAREARRKKGGPKKITLLGAVNATATRSGLSYLANKVLPLLEKKVAQFPLEVHVIGRGEIPSDAQSLRKYPFVKLRGYVDDIVSELSSTDVFLVPTPITLGIRTRVLNAFSYGLCIVSHEANAAGIPELKHEQNSLLSKSPQEMVDQILRALTETSLQDTLSDGARETFEKYFSEETAAQRILYDVENLVKTKETLSAA